MISSSVKDLFREHVTNIRIQTRDMLTDFDADPDAATSLATLVSHYFMILHASRFLHSTPRYESLEHFASRETPFEDFNSRQGLARQQKEIEANLRRLCKIHDVDYEEALKEFQMQVTPATGDSAKASSQFHTEGDPSRQL